MDRAELKELWRCASVDERVSLEAVAQLADEADELLRVSKVGDLATVADEYDRLHTRVEELEEERDDARESAREAKQKNEAAKNSLIALLRDVYGVDVPALENEIIMLKRQNATLRDRSATRKR